MKINRHDRWLGGFTVVAGSGGPGGSGNAGELTPITAGSFTLRGHPDLPEPTWDVVGPDGTALGSVVRGPGWPQQETTYSLRDARQQVLAVVGRGGASTRDRYIVTGPDGDRIGTLDQGSSTFEPISFTLRSVDGADLRLDGPGDDGVRTLRAAGGDVVGEAQPDPAEPDSAGQAQLVRISDAVAGPARLLAVVAICCRDLIEYERRRTQSGRLYGT